MEQEVKSIGIASVNNLSWEIKEVSYIDITNEGILGLCIPSQQSILILNSICLEKKRQTLIHELCHAFMSETQIKTHGYDDEDFCNFVSFYGEEIITIANLLYPEDNIEEEDEKTDE